MKAKQYKGLARMIEKTLAIKPGKRGGTFTIETLVYLILLIMTFVIIGSFLVDVRKGSEKAERDQICRTSAIVNAKTKTWGMELFYLYCPQWNVRVTKEDIDPVKLRREIESKQKKIKKKKDKQGASSLSSEEVYIANLAAVEDKELQKYEVDRIMAEQLEDCWSILGEGKLQLFGEWAYASNPITDLSQLPSNVANAIGDLFSLNEAPVFCVICSRVKFDKEVKDALGLNTIQLNDWLKNHPVSIEGKDMSYYDYLIDDLHDATVWTPTFKYDVTKPYAVVYARANFNYPANFIDRVVSTGQQAYSGDIASYYIPKSGASTVILVPYEDALQYCTHVAN